MRGHFERSKTAWPNGPVKVGDKWTVHNAMTGKTVVDNLSTVDEAAHLAAVENAKEEAARDALRVSRPLLAHAA